MMYEFKTEDAIAFASHVHIKAREKHGQLHFAKCPYCGQQTSDKYTFAINLENGQFCCLRSSCGAKGNMITLSKDFDFSLGSDIDEYYRPKKQYREFKTPKEPIVPKEPALKYLESRGISEKVAERYEVTNQTKNENILAFLFYDEKGVMRFVKYRKMDFDKTKDKNKEWCETGGKPILFGMKQCDMNNKTLVITEGQIDSLSLAEVGIENAVSVPTGAKGFTWIPYCWDFMQNFDKIIVFGDYENGHITLLDEIRLRFRKQIYHVREEDYKDCKDANEILRKYGREYLRSCVENAVHLKPKYLIDIADVEDVNLFDVEKLKTGLGGMDRLLYGGLPFPGLVVITGKRGEGKSTLGSQIIAESMSQGYKVFCYSGELGAAQFKNCLMRQLAGGNHTFKYQTRNGYEGYEISKSNKTDINNWIRGKLFLFDNTMINEKVGLLDAIEETIQQEGTRVIVLDNLMTALSLEGGADDKLERQSALTQRLAHMAMQYGVIIILIAHKRKNQTADEMDDISGSADITNLATVAISYGMHKDLAEGQRKMRLLKNRLFGKLGSWDMEFDERSNRIYGQGDDVNKEFGWEKHEFEPVEEELKEIFGE